MNIKHNNNYTNAELIFTSVLTWAADKNPSKTKEQMCSDIEKVLDLVQDKENHYQKGYKTGYDDGYDDGASNSAENCCGKNR